MSTDPTAVDLLRRTESLLSALHGSVGRHDNLAANFGCAGCELRDAVSQALATLAVPSAAVPPTQAALRDRIRRAVCEAEGFGWDSDMLEPDEYGEVADAVLAVLPAPVDRGAVTSLRRMAVEATPVAASAASPNGTGAGVAASGDRSAVLREAADRLDARAATLDGLSSSDYDNWADAARELRSEAAELRRLAEAPQPETEAHPAEHAWAAELYDPLADEWVPGTRYTDRKRAVNALAHARSIGPTWKDGTPTQRRLVRATTTYTVEQPDAAPAVVAQPGMER